MKNKSYLLIIMIITIVGYLLFSFYRNKDIEPIANAKALPIPVLLQPSKIDEAFLDYYLTAQISTTNFIGDKQTPTMGYNGSFLGPVIKVTKGEAIRMHITNNLQDDTSVHWHG